MTAQHIELGEPKDNEKEPINFLVSDLPDNYVVITNGKYNRGTNEVDAVVIAPHAIYILELKSHGCNFSGDQIKWVLPSGEQIASPIKIAREKTQRIKSIITRYRSYFDDIYCQPVVFMTAESFTQAKLSDVKDNAKNNQVHGRNDIIKYLTNAQGFDSRSRLSSLIPYHPELIKGFKADFEIPLPEIIKHYKIWSVLWVTEEYYAVSATTSEYPKNYILRIYDLTSKSLSSDGIRAYRKRFQKDFSAIQKINQPGQSSSDGHEIILTSLEPFNFNIVINGSEKNYFVCPMQFTEGRLLQDKLISENLPRWIRFSIAAQLCRGIDFIHRAGVAHRNLLPENILLTRDNLVKIFNFDHGKIIEGGSTMLNNMAAYPSRSEQPLFAQLCKPDSSALFKDVQNKGIPAFDQARYYDIYALGGILLALFCKNQNHVALPNLDCLMSNLDKEIVEFIETCRKGNPSELLKLDLTKLVGIFNMEMDREHGGILPILKDGSKVLNNCLVIKELKTTNISRTYLCKQEQTQEDRVVKFLNVPDDMAKAEILAFRDISQKIDARYTARFIDCGVVRVKQGKILPSTSTDGHEVYYILQEFVPGPTLHDFIKNPDLNVEILYKLTRGVISAAAAVHHVGYTHRDIKPSNFIVQYSKNNPDLTVKIIDFGLSRRASQKGELEGGTQGYLPPEVKKGGDWTFSGDVWSVAHTIMAIFCGEKTDELNGPIVDWTVIQNLQWDEFEKFLRMNCDEDPQKRHADAGIMLQAFDQLVQNKEASSKKNQDANSDQSVEPEPEPRNDPGSPHPIIPSPLLPAQGEPKTSMSNSPLELLSLLDHALGQKKSWSYEVFDSDILSIWRRVNAIMKLEIEENKVVSPQEYEQRNQLRPKLAGVVDVQFEQSIRAIEEARGDETFNLARKQGNQWNSQRESLGLETTGAFDRLERAVLRFGVYQSGVKAYNQLMAKLSEFQDTSENRKKMRPEIEKVTRLLNEAINNLVTHPTPLLGEVDARSQELVQFIKIIEENEIVQKIMRDSSLDISIRQSEEYHVQMNGLKQKKAAGDLTADYFVLDERGEKTGVIAEIPIDLAIKNCDILWKKWAEEKIRSYSNKLTEEGLKAEGPFTHDPLDYQNEFNELVARIKRPITDLSAQCQADYRDTSNIINQADRNFQPLKRRLMDIDEKKPEDALKALIELEKVWQDIKEKAPVLDADYQRKYNSLVEGSVPDQLKEVLETLKVRFSADPSAAEGEISVYLDRLQSFPALFKSERISLKNLSDLIEHYHQEIKASQGETPPDAIRRLEKLGALLDQENINRPQALNNRLETLKALSQPIEYAQELISRVDPLLSAFRNGQYVPSDLLSQVSSLVEEITSSLPTLNERRFRVQALQNVIADLNRHNRQLVIVKNYLSALNGIGQPGANLADIQAWIRSIRQQQAGAPSPLVSEEMLKPIESRVAQYQPNDPAVKSTIDAINRILDKAKAGGTENLSELLNLWTQLSSQLNLPTSHASDRDVVYQKLKNTIFAQSQQLAGQLSETTDLRLVKRLADWCQENSLDHVKLDEWQSEKDARDKLAAFSQPGGNLHDKIEAAYSAWCSVKENKAPDAKAYRLILLKLKALVDAHSGDYRALKQAKADPVLKEDVTIIVRSAQLLLQEAVRSYETLEYLSSGQTVDINRLDQTRTTLLNAMGQGQDDGQQNIPAEADSDQITTAGRIRELWEQLKFDTLLQNNSIPVVPTPVQLEAEIEFRKEAYTNLNLLMRSLSPSSTLKQMHYTCINIAPNILRSTTGPRNQPVFERLPTLQTLVQDLWREWRDEVIAALAAGGN